VQIPERRAKAAQKLGNKNFMLKALAKTRANGGFPPPHLSRISHFPARTSNVMQQQRQQQQVN